MSKQNFEKVLRRELEVLNEVIDWKILRGLPYSKEAKRHKTLLSNLLRLRNQSRFGWFGRSLSKFSII